MLKSETFVIHSFDFTALSIRILDSVIIRVEQKVLRVGHSSLILNTLFMSRALYGAVAAYFRVESVGEFVVFQSPAG